MEFNSLVSFSGNELVVPKEEEPFFMHDYDHQQLDLSWQFEPLSFIESFFQEHSSLSLPSNGSFLPHDNMPQDDFCNSFDCPYGIWDETSSGVEDRKDVVIRINGEDAEKLKEKVGSSLREEKGISLKELSCYFYMPITQAAKELNVGLTQLKKRCRELGIPRWPHRKMKSLQTLIRNVQELSSEDGEVAKDQVRTAVGILEQQKKLMEMVPSMQIGETTKKLRQACFKANYKKRRLMGVMDLQPTTYSFVEKLGQLN